MSTLGKHTYRIAVDFGKVGDSWIDYETSDVFHFPSGVGLKIQIGIRETKSPETFYDLSDITSLALEIKDLKNSKFPPDADDPAYMSQPVTTLDATTLTLTDWQAGTSQHATFDYSAEDTSLPPGKYWMVISGVLNNGAPITPGWAKMEVVQDGTGPEGVADLVPVYFDYPTENRLGFWQFGSAVPFSDVSTHIGVKTILLWQRWLTADSVQTAIDLNGAGLELNIFSVFAGTYGYRLDGASGESFFNRGVETAGTFDGWNFLAVKIPSGISTGPATIGVSSTIDSVYFYSEEIGDSQILSIYEKNKQKYGL